MKKTIVIPKHTAYISEILTEIENSYSSSKEGKIILPTELKEKIKKSGGTIHTTTIQNLFGIFSIYEHLKKEGWKVLEVKEGHLALQKIKEDDYKELIKLLKNNLENVKNKK